VSPLSGVRGRLVVVDDALMRTLQRWIVDTLELACLATRLVVGREVSHCPGDLGQGDSTGQLSTVTLMPALVPLSPPE
jgi:hypothetical protein